MKSVMFSANADDDVQAIKEGRARPSEIATRRAKALMAKSGADPSRFAEFARQVFEDDPELGRLYVFENGAV